MKPTEEQELYEMVHRLANEVYRLRMALIVAGANDRNLRGALEQEKVSPHEGATPPKIG